MSQRALWDKAAMCAFAARTTSDPTKRAILTCFGAFWVCLAYANPDQLDDALALDIAVVERMQAELIGVRPTFH